MPKSCTFRWGGVDLSYLILSYRGLDCASTIYLIFKLDKIR